MDFLEGPRPRLFAHRGGGLEAPENTIEAFAAGLAAGCERLELDVRATSDGEVIVLHDETLDRTTDGRGLARAQTLAEIRACDAGARFVAGDGSQPFRERGVRVPTLAEVLEAFPGVPLNIEVKQSEPAIESAVLAVLDRFEARRQVLLAAEKGPIMERIRAVATNVITSFSVEDVAIFLQHWQDGTLAGYRPPGVALQVPPSFMGKPVVTEEVVALAHDLGLEVHVWTIDDEVEMERLLDLGADGIITDRPTVGAKVFGRRGLR
jgi:glycerophosphoryl diester phosphodiesterase